MVKEFYIGVYPGRYGEKGRACIVEKINIQGKSKPGYAISLLRESGQIYGGEIDFILRRVEEQVRMLKSEGSNTIKVVVDQTHHGEPVMGAFKDLQVDVKGVVMTDNETVKEENRVLTVPKRDVLGNLQLLKDELRFDFNRDRYSSNVELFDDLYKGIEDFVIRNADAPVSRVFKANDKNIFDNMYFASAITAWYADYTERHAG